MTKCSLFEHLKTYQNECFFILMVESSFSSFLFRMSQLVKSIVNFYVLHLGGWNNHRVINGKMRVNRQSVLINDYVNVSELSEVSLESNVLRFC